MSQSLVFIVFLWPGIVSAITPGSSRWPEERPGIPSLWGTLGILYSDGRHHADGHEDSKGDICGLWMNGNSFHQADLT